MLKNLGIVVLLGTFAAGMAGQPNQTPDQKQTVGAEGHPTIAVPNRPNKVDCGQKDQPEAPCNTPTRNTPVERPRWWNRPDWWILLVGAITAGVVGWQSWETRKSAEAARTSIDMLISKERARIRIEVDGLYSRGTPYVNFFIHCHGPTEAFIGESRVMAEMTQSSDPPSSPSGFPMTIASVVKDTKIEEAAYLWNMREFSVDDYARLDAGKVFVHFYGFVEYKDRFDRDRKTTFCYILKGSGLKDLRTGEAFRTWYNNGPPEMNRAT